MRHSNYLTSTASALLLAAAAWAGTDSDEDLHALSSASGRGPAAYAVSIFAPSNGEELQPIEGYSEGAVYTAPRGGTIVANEQAITLRRNGIYRVHLEGVLLYDANDQTVDDGAASRFNLLINGIEWVGCMTPERSSASLLPAAFGIGGAPTREASCSVDFTLEVRGAQDDLSSLPVTFGRGSEVSVVLLSNGLARGDNSFVVGRVEVTRLGN